MRSVSRQAPATIQARAFLLSDDRKDISDDKDIRSVDLPASPAIESVQAPDVPHAAKNCGQRDDHQPDDTAAKNDDEDTKKHWHFLILISFTKTKKSHVTGLFQNDPNAVPSRITATRARTALTIPTITMSK